MGQKVHPRGFRLGITSTWQSKWYGGKKYAEFLVEDEKIRSHIMNRSYDLKLPDGKVIEATADISEVYIERSGASKISVTIMTAKPGVVIGKKGSEVQKIKTELEELCNRKDINLNIKDLNSGRSPGGRPSGRPSGRQSGMSHRAPNPSVETDAYLVSRNVAAMLERRTSHKRAMKRVMFNAMRSGAKGIKVMVAGRLGGAEIARVEWYREGQIPLQTLRANITYGFSEAKTKYGVIGIKVWIYHGEQRPGNAPTTVS